MSTKLNTVHLQGFVKDHEIDALAEQVKLAHRQLHEGSGQGADFLGWLTLPEDYDHEEYARIKAAAARIQKDSDVLLVIGIGGSYLGARAVIEAIRSQFYNSLNKNVPEVYFLGNSISTAYLRDVLALCEGKRVSVNVISKSGTTTEPAIAFRICKQMLEERYGVEGARERIYVTTDKAKGALRKLSNETGYETFVVPDNVGGRYSVLTACGLLPIAVAGVDTDKLFEGAAAAMKELNNDDIKSNDAYRYAAVRNCLLRKNKAIELLVSYEPRMTLMNEWYKQLFGESEGKDNKGLYPSSVVYSTDLHSLGQYVQDGMRTMFETVLHIGSNAEPVVVEEAPVDFDGLNYLAGKSMADINECAYQGTIQAHKDGLVPNVVLEVPEMNEFELGYLIYFFELTCAMSGYLLGVNPFDQPGVEAYKKNMFALLGKPGYEALGEELRAKLGK